MVTTVAEGLISLQLSLYFLSGCGKPIYEASINRSNRQLLLLKPAFFKQLPATTAHHLMIRKPK